MRLTHAQEAERRAALLLAFPGFGGFLGWRKRIHSGSECSAGGVERVAGAHFQQLARACMSGTSERRQRIWSERRSERLDRSLFQGSDRRARAAIRFGDCEPHGGIALCLVIGRGLGAEQATRPARYLRKAQHSAKRMRGHQAMGELHG
jgi:hypothetical protein